MDCELDMEHDADHPSRNQEKISVKRRSGEAADHPDRFPSIQTDRYVEDNGQLYRILISHMPYGFALCQTRFKTGHRSPDFRIIEANPAFEAFSFCGNGSLIGKNLHDIFPELAAACRFAAIGSGGSNRPENFRIHQTNQRNEFEATILPLGQYRMVIFIVDATEIVSGNKTPSLDIDSEHSEGQSILDLNTDQHQTALITAKKLLSDMQEELRRYKSDLKLVNKKLLQANNAISVLAGQIDRKRDELEKKIARKVSSQVLPLVEELQQDPIPEGCQAKLDVISAYLRSLTPGVSRGGDIIISLSPTELKVAMMVKKGFSTEDTARILNLSPQTVKTHRRSIRRKLNIRNSPVNLSTYLKFNLGSVRHVN
jgi:PAS domain-containing protein